MVTKKGLVYFASPFFTEEQIEREERLKQALRDVGYEVFSPKEYCHCPPDASQGFRENVFSANVSALVKADVIFVVTDGKDVGTIWEAGFGYALAVLEKEGEKKRTPYGKKIIVYYCETLKDDQPFNLMLAQSGDLVLRHDYEIKQMHHKLLKGGENFEGVIE